MSREGAVRPVVVSLPLAAASLQDPLPDAVSQVERDEVRLVLTRDGEPVAAVVPMEDLRALEELDQAEDAHWSRLADAAIARWKAEGEPMGTSHEDMLARHGIIPDSQ